MGGEDDSELSDYPGEEEDLNDGEEIEGDFGETGQISPTQTSPDRESDFMHNKSENMRNFMNQAQPAGPMDDGSQIEMQQQMYPDQSHENTNDKEGGSMD